MICLEHGKSVIQPKPYKERAKRTEYPRRPCHRNDIRQAIDRALLKKPKDFEELIRLLMEAGFEYKSGKQPSLRGKDGGRFLRFRSLGEGYTVGDLKASLSEKERPLAKNGKQQNHRRTLDLPINIQEKLAAGKGAGYERWAKVYNLKAAAKAILFLQEKDIHTMELLREKTEDITRQSHELLDSVKQSENRLTEIAILRKHIVNYAKTRETYVAYRKAGYSRKFYEAHREALTLHKAAKEAFDQLEIKKIPKVKELNAKYAKVLESKKKTYAEYRKVRAEMQDYQIALKVAEACVGEEAEKEMLQKEQEQGQAQSQER